MTVAPGDLHTDAANGRRLKAHKKSRKGCGNCKLRKVKVWPLNSHCWVSLTSWECDEKKPACKRCDVYGTLCDYDSPSTELQSAAHGVRNITILRPVLSHRQIVLQIINSVKEPQPRGSSSRSLQSSHDQYDFSSQDLDVMYRFHTRTILSLGPTNMQQANQFIYSKLTYSVGPYSCSPSRS